MRTLIDQTGGIATVSQTGSTSATVEVAQAEKQVLDISAFSGLDVEFRAFSLTQVNGSSSATALLYLETSMQKEDSSTTLWTQIGPSAIQLYEFVGTNRATLFTLSSDLGRYLRWRIEIPSNTPALELTAVFQITGFGRS